MAHVWLAFGSTTLLASPELRHDEALARHAYLRPAPDPVLVVGRVKQWVRHCEAVHAACWINRPPRIRGLRVLRFLDVVDNRLVETFRIPQYVALSYVWGAVAGVRLTRANKAEIMLPGALKTVTEHAPVTIRDAIELTRMLGVRYLWVDSLCLVQNDDADLKQGIWVMDMIYEQAWLTIVGAGGHDANAGLLGLRPGDRGGYPYSEVRPGLFMGLYKGVDAYLKTSVYRTRGWTLQEEYLSRRRLYFVGGRVFFRCRECERCETCDDDPDPGFGYRLFPDRDIVITNIELEDPVRAYRDILTSYSKRTLTNDSDALRAMAGIMRRVSEKLGYNMVHGLPSGAFDLFLLFYGYDHLLDRHVQLRRRPGFPSWSWAGWRGQLQFDSPMWRSSWDDKTAWLRDGTWIVWYQRLPGGAEIPVWDPDHVPQTEKPMDFERYTERSVFHSEYVSIPAMCTVPTAGLWPMGTDLRPYPVLRFWTLTVWLVLNTIGVLGDETRLFDVEGDCGYIIIDGIDESNMFDTEEDPEEPEQKLVEVILLSTMESQVPPRSVDWVPGHYWRYYYIMLLEWKDGVAERRGLGRIYEGCLERAFAPGPMWKEITLA